MEGLEKCDSKIKFDTKAIEILNEFDINQFKEESEEEIANKVSLYREKILARVAYSNSIFENNPIKKLVSKKKIRFEFEGFDLDLTYITDRIIAMGYPADNIEKIYRNPLQEVQRFFMKRHGENYKVYNLCSERVYPLNTFKSQSYYPFDDHEAPPINLLMPFCQDVHEWLGNDSQNVVAIHCKAGKGRTGLMICCYFLFSGFLQNAEQALKFYGLMRTSNGKGVTIESQIRYLYFFEEIVKRKIPYPLNSPKLKLKKILFNSVPNFNLFSEGSTPYFEIKNNNFKYNYKEDNDELRDYKQGDEIIFKLSNIYLTGDFLIVFYNKRMFGDVKMFKLWYNTYFIPKDGRVFIKKKFLDLKIKKDKDFNLAKNFVVELVFENENVNKNDLDNEDDYDFFKDVDGKNDFKIYL